MPRDCTAPRAWAWVQRVLADVQSHSCGGIQYTQPNMAKQSKNKINNNNRSGGAKRGPQHVFLNCRDAIQPNTPGGVPASSGTNVEIVTSNVPVNLAGVLNPLGLTSATVSGSAFAAGTPGNMQGPPLRGLYNRALGFQYYRVTRAKLVMVGTISSAAIGSFTLAGYSDPADVRALTYSPFNSGPNVKTFDLASLSTKEASVPIPVDSSWKKVTTVLSAPGNQYPFNGATSSVMAIYSTVSDVSFGAWTALVTSAGTGVVGSLYIDYDVEFKSPIDAAVNY